jgi:alkanesulfonate monooxygenase SsuD/methylene tetrahydromethanopterin reductase-like flavin-dependent oxidoreductase (luciferase family)
VLKRAVSDIRASVAEAGRDPRTVKIFNLHTVIADESDAKAKAKHREYREHVDLDGALALGSGWMGIDFAKYELDEPLRHIWTNAVQSSVDAFSSADPSKVWTVRELAEWIGIGGLGPLTVGGPQKVADELQAFVEETDVDGFNLAYAVTPETFETIVDHLVPELQRRGAYKTAYRPGTLREKLFDGGARLPSDHPGARYRDPAALSPALDAAE